VGGVGVVEDELSSGPDGCGAAEVSVGGGVQADAGAVVVSLPLPKTRHRNRRWDLRMIEPENWTIETYRLRPGTSWGHAGLMNPAGAHV